MTTSPPTTTLQPNPVDDENPDTCTGPAPEAPLTPEEQDVLHDCEAQLGRYKQASLDAGRSLRTIREGKLYRQTHATFEAYCHDKWGFTADRAGQLMRAAETVETLAEAGVTDLPTNEAQVRPLSKLGDEQQAGAWKQALAENGSASNVSLKKVEALVRQNDGSATPSDTRLDEEVDYTAEFVGNVAGRTAAGTAAHGWPWGDDALARFKRVTRLDQDAVRDALTLASLSEEVTAETVDEAAFVAANERREDGGRSARLVVVGIADAIQQLNRDTLNAAARGEAKPTIIEDIDYVPGANEDADGDRAAALPLLCVIPKGMCPDALLDAYPSARGSITANAVEVVVELAELEKYGGPVRDGVLDIAAVREASRKAGIKKTFNETGKLVGWARFTTNPSTGCDHGCSLRFCYASDIALKFYPQCFVPTIWPARLDAFGNTALPDPGHTCAHAPGWDRSVFLGSMTDLMNRSFPDWWIEAVLGEIKARPKWTVFVLTKIAHRLQHFDFPPNAAVGVTVTTQREVAKAAAGQRAVRGGAFKWASVEPMLGRVDPGPLLDAGVTFYAVGGQSRTRWSGEKQPSPEAVRFLIGTAWARGAYVYHKDNLDFRAHIPFPGHLPWTGAPDAEPRAGSSAAQLAPDRKPVPARGPGSLPDRVPGLKVGTSE